VVQGLKEKNKKIELEFRSNLGFEFKLRFKIIMVELFLALRIV
jgi:hypothetical protein